MQRDRVHVTLHPIPPYFPHILGKFSFLFYQCTGAWKGAPWDRIFGIKWYLSHVMCMSPHPSLSPFYYTHFSCKTWHLGQLTAVPRPYIHRKGEACSNLGSFQLGNSGSFQLSFMTLAFCVWHRCFTSREQVDYMRFTVMYIFWTVFYILSACPTNTVLPFSLDLSSAETHTEPDNDNLGFFLRLRIVSNLL